MKQEYKLKKRKFPLPGQPMQCTGADRAEELLSNKTTADTTEKSNVITTENTAITMYSSCKTSAMASSLKTLVIGPIMQQKAQGGVIILPG